MYFLYWILAIPHRLRNRKNKTIGGTTIYEASFKDFVVSPSSSLLCVKDDIAKIAGDNLVYRGKLFKKVDQVYYGFTAYERY